MLRLSRRLASRQLADTLFLLLCLLSGLPARLGATPVAHGRAPIAALQQTLQPQDVTGNVTGPDFSLSLGVLPDVIVRGADPVTLTTIVAAVGSYEGPVQLSITGDLPSSIAVAFTPSTVTPLHAKPTWTATVASQLVITAQLVPPTPTTKALRDAPSSRLSRSTAALALLPALLLVPAGCLRKKRRFLPPLCALILCALPLLSGCGQGRYPPAIPAEVYYVTIVATGANGLQHSVPLVLRVD